MAIQSVTIGPPIRHDTPPDSSLLGPPMRHVKPPKRHVTEHKNV